MDLSTPHPHPLTSSRYLSIAINMLSYVMSALILAAAASAVPQYPQLGCRELSIPVTVSVPRFIVNATVNDNWDAIALTLALTRRDFSENTDPLPISGQTSEPVESKFKVGATLCGRGGPTVVLTHGILESKLYVSFHLKLKL